MEMVYGKQEWEKSGEEEKEEKNEVEEEEDKERIVTKLFPSSYRISAITASSSIARNSRQSLTKSRLNFIACAQRCSRIVGERSV
uniref:Uncharacterized protein n=1 Tax=Heterorhabditis bacteriophora TaxID=37862 RepID=A0A1I7XFR1_HETBA